MAEKVATWGCFDGELHQGHLSLFEFCLGYADQLYVFLVPDEVIIKEKNRRPLYNVVERTAHVQAVDGVTVAIALLGDIEHQYSQVLRERPSIYCFGPDQAHSVDKELEKRLLKQGAQIIRSEKVPNISTTRLYFNTPSSDQKTAL